MFRAAQRSTSSPPFSSRSATGRQLMFQLHPKLYSKATKLLYRGAVGGGKLPLTRAAAISWCSVIAGLQVYLSICNDWDDLSCRQASRLTIPGTS